MGARFSISYPWDEDYFSAMLENGIQVTGKPRALGNLSVTNGAGAVVYLAVWDSAAANGAAPGPVAGDNRPVKIVPVAAPGWFQYSVHGGHDLKNGMYIGAWNSLAAALAGTTAPDAGNVLFIEVEYGACRVVPQNS